MYVKTIRRDSGLVEHICEHGIGHPAYGSAHWMGLHSNDVETWMVHGCDGCCNDQEWQIQSLKSSVEIANNIISQYQQALGEIHDDAI